MYLKQLIIALLVIGFSACASDSQQTAEETAPRKKEVLKSAKMPKKAAQRNDNSAKAITTSGNGRINWLKIEDLESANKKEKRKVLVDLYTDWCGWCKKMDKATFQNAEIADYVNENFHAVKFNAEQKSEINFAGEKHKFLPSGRRGANALAYKFLNGRMSYPTIAFLDEKLNRIDSFPGFKQPHQMEPMLVFIDGNHYKKKSLSQFSSSYKSNINGKVK